MVPRHQMTEIDILKIYFMWKSNLFIGLYYGNIILCYLSHAEYMSICRFYAYVRKSYIVQGGRK
jgi:hypothetical protein